MSCKRLEKEVLCPHNFDSVYNIDDQVDGYLANDGHNAVTMKILNLSAEWAESANAGSFVQLEKITTFAGLNIGQPVIFTKCKVALKSRHLTFNYQLVIDWGDKIRLRFATRLTNPSLKLDEENDNNDSHTFEQIEDWKPVNQNLVCFEWSKKVSVNCIALIWSTVFL